MRYAIISDVHANETALRAVLADAADARAEKLICLGDVLGYGPDPVAAHELLYRRAHVCLAGNHDDAVSGRFPVEDFTSFAAAAVARHRAALAPSALDWLRHLPHVCDFPGPAGGFACAHGEFSDPTRFNYVLEPSDARPSWRARAEPLLFVGHSHKPGIFVLGTSGEPHALEPMDFVLEPGKRYLVNVGSVGYPRSGVCRSFYCLYDDGTGTVSFRSLPFDLEGYRAKMNGQGLDEAPWMRARAEERRHAEVRGAERFGKSGKEKKKKTAAHPLIRKAASAPVAPAIAAPPAPAPRPHGPFGAAFVVGALVVALAGVWCAAHFVSALPPREDLSDVKIAEVAGPEVLAPPPVVPAASPTQLGPVVERRRCTVPAGDRRLRFSVKLKKGGAPVWVRLRFEDGNGASVGDGLWYQGVRLSKRSPKKGLVAPGGATAASIEVRKAQETEACEVAEVVLEPFKERVEQ